MSRILDLLKDINCQSSLASVPMLYLTSLTLCINLLRYVPNRFLLSLEFFEADSFGFVSKSTCDVTFRRIVVVWICLCIGFRPS